MIGDFHDGANRFQIPTYKGTSHEWGSLILRIPMKSPRHSEMMSPGVPT